MHELAITQNVLELALSEAEKVKAKKISKISLVIGEMTGVVDESVKFYFEFISKDTIASGATLVFNRVPIEARCRNCHHKFVVWDLNWVCPNCGGANLEVVAGNELYLESIEVEKDGNQGS